MKVRRVSDEDIKEVDRFRQYLADLHGGVSAREFADKWAEYLGCTREIAEAHFKAINS